MNPINSLKSLLIIVLIAIMSGVPTAAHATLAVTPTIIVIEGRDRFADVNLINTGDGPVTYDMNWRFFTMAGKDIGYKAVVESITDFDLSQNIVFSPKKVTLEPKVRQKVRIALRLKGEPPAPGDYRAHLEFMGSSGAAIKEKAEKSKPKGEDSSGVRGQAVGLGINVGYSIPVIYRVGESTVKPVIGGVAVEAGKAGKLYAKVEVSRTEGPYGVIGRLLIYHIEGGKKTKIGEVSNANIFPEITSRTYNVPLSVDALRSGDVQVVVENAIKSRKGEVLAEKTIRIQ